MSLSRREIMMLTGASTLSVSRIGEIAYKVKTRGIPEEIPYTRLLKDARSGVYASVTLDGSRIYATDKNKKLFMAAIPDNENVISRLENAPVEISVEEGNTLFTIGKNLSMIFAPFAVAGYILKNRYDDMQREPHTPDDEELVTIHETGHAIVGIHAAPLYYLAHATVLNGRHDGGHVLFGAIKKNLLRNQSKDVMEGILAMTYGGIAAEKMMLGENQHTSGPTSDIFEGTQTASAMVRRYGMSKLGSVNYEEYQGNWWRRLFNAVSPPLAEQTRREIDLEVRRIILEAEKRAAEILTKHRDQYEKLLPVFREKKTLTGEEIYKILGIEDPRPKPVPVPPAHPVPDNLIYGAGMP